MNDGNLTTESNVELKTGNVREFLDEIVQGNFHVKRKGLRNRILAHVDLLLSDGTTKHAMIRDQSRTGLGFVHNLSIPCGDATVTIGTTEFRTTLAVRITWCRKLKDDVFVSGAIYLRETSTPSEPQSLSSKRM